MTRVVALERATRRLHYRWTCAAVTTCAVAGALTVAAGGESVWLRIVLAVVSVERLWAAIRHRVGLGPSIVLSTLAVLVIPVDARLDRTFVSAVAAVAIVSAAEAAHVARRLVTVAPVGDTRRDLAWIVRVAALGALGTAAAAGSAHVAPASWAVAVVGVVVAATGAMALVATERRGSRVGVR